MDRFDGRSSINPASIASPLLFAWINLPPGASAPAPCRNPLLAATATGRKTAHPLAGTHLRRPPQSIPLAFIPASKARTKVRPSIPPLQRAPGAIATASRTAAELTETRQQLLDRSAGAFERFDLDEFAELLREDATFSIPSASVREWLGVKRPISDGLRRSCHGSEVPWPHVCRELSRSGRPSTGGVVDESGGDSNKRFGAGLWWKEERVRSALTL